MRNLRKQRLEQLALWLESLYQPMGHSIHWTQRDSRVWFTYTNNIWYDPVNNRTLLGTTGAICQMFKPFTIHEVESRSYIPAMKCRNRAKRLLGMDEQEFCKFIRYAIGSHDSPKDYAEGIHNYMRTLK